MDTRLRETLDKLECIAAQLAAPETYGDAALCARLLREQKALTPLAEALRRCEALEGDLAAAEELGLPAAERAAIAAERAAAEETLRALLLPPDARDGRSVIMELRAGTGGEEAALFAAELYRMYSLYAARRGWRVEIADLNETELGGLKEIVFSVEGEGVWSRLKYESGAHCVKRVPKTESSGRIQTSTATVAVLPEAEEAEVTLSPQDIRIDTYRSSGAGGQKVNKTESAIRVTHLPTGIVVTCQDERSQFKNKDRALRILRSRLLEAERQRSADALAADRRSQVGTGSRSEKIRTYFYLRGQVADQRLSGGERFFQLQPVLNGELDPLIDALTAADRAAKTAESEKSQNEN